MIRAWHIARGFDDVGYHFFCQTNGKLEKGRDLEVPGAHVKGYNHDTIGICLAGEHYFSSYQWDTLKMLLGLLKRIYPASTLHGHSEFSDKSCPVFDVAPWKKFWDSL